ncbi:MAG: hypothetical protein JNL58_01030 [Planctomyces sp.]|nr:hypothetical protein [Planctomyces sp.]
MKLDNQRRKAEPSREPEHAIRRFSHRSRTAACPVTAIVRCEGYMADNEYQSLSAWSVTALLLAVFAISGLLTPLATFFFAVPSILAALFALFQIRKYQMIGRGLALSSMAFAGLLCVLIPSWFAYLYRSEADSSHLRIDFQEALQSDSFESLVGKDICIKGYPVLDSWTNEPLTKFFVSPDGDERQKQTAIEVELSPEESRVVHFEPLAVSGRLVRFHSAAQGVQYRLVNAVARKSRTPFHIVAPNPNSKWNC